MFTAWLIGFAFGFVGSMPIAGPIAALVLGRGIENRPESGLFVAFGAAIAEGIYACLAFWGFSELFVGYPWLEPASRAAGAVVLVAIGIRFALRRSAGVARDVPVGVNTGRKRNLALGFTITALNPTLVATWSAAVTMLYSLDVVEFHALHALPFSAGAMLGIAGWFTTLLLLLGRFRARFEPATLVRVLRYTGVALVLLGIGMAVRFALYFRPAA